MKPQPTLQAVEFRGRPAAPGVTAGPLVKLDRAVGTRRQAKEPSKEQDDLRAAVAAAVIEIADLADKVGGDGADVLEFQVAMLEDEELVAPALERIAAGADAATAWAQAIATQLAEYEAADDAYFRARTADLEDIGDRVARRLGGEDDVALPVGAVLAGEDVTPSRFLSVDWSRGGGVALTAGSASSHVAMLARSRGVPMVVGLGSSVDLNGHETVIVDGDAGRVVLSPGESEWAAYRAARVVAESRAAEEAAIAAEPASTADGEPVAVMINVADPDELDRLDPAICDGVGLVRTEFLFHGATRLPDEDSQYRAYRKIVEWAAPRPVVLRTLDAGGDKPIDGLTITGESNPFLGVRGIRLSLARPDVFRVQIRALLRAAAHGNAKVMLPMVTVPEEVDRATALFDAAFAELTSEGVRCRRPELGIMVEVPAVAIAPENFDRAAFFSIGSNDLTQYVTASARDIAGVAGLCDPGHPAVLSLIANLVGASRRMGREISLCGDMGGDPVHLPALIAAGLRSVSVAPPLVGRTKRAISTARAVR